MTNSQSTQSQRSHKETSERVVTARSEMDMSSVYGSFACSNSILLHINRSPTRGQLFACDLATKRHNDNISCGPHAVLVLGQCAHATTKARSFTLTGRGRSGMQLDLGCQNPQAAADGMHSEMPVGDAVCSNRTRFRPVKPDEHRGHLQMHQ